MSFLTQYQAYPTASVNTAVASGGVQSGNGGGETGGYDNYSGGDNGGGGGYDDYNSRPCDVAGFLDNDEGAPPPEKPKEVYVPEDLEDDQLFDFQINSGINFEKYDAIPINVSKNAQSSNLILKHFTTTASL